MEDYSQYDRYDLSEIDPYCINDSSCLKNNLGFTNTADLNKAEEEITKITLAELVTDPVRPNFDLDHLAVIHLRIFGDIYPFAGEVRTIDISKGSHLFLPQSLIQEEATECFTQLKDEALLKGLEKKEFAIRAGFFLGWINKIHAFREGNGRTQRALLDQLAALNGYAFEWNAISAQAMGQACREARTDDLMAKSLSKLLLLNIKSE